MKDVLIIYCLFCLCSIGASDDESEEDSANEVENAIDIDNNVGYVTDFQHQDPKLNCWMSLNAEEHFNIMDEIDSRYSNVREEIQKALQDNEFDKSMIKGFVRERGVALREIHSHQHKKWMIPSGINLGGYCMLRMPASILFFHRMKLRNNTYFRVDELHNELDKMVVRINLSLNDLHLKGAYERSLTDSDPSVLIYAPTFGEVEFLLKDVKYKMEGRYRLIKTRLLIELVTSEIFVDDVLMTYVTQVIESASVKVSKDNLGGFMSRLKTDLDKWIKDYYNDFMIYAPLDQMPNIDELALYDKAKGTALEEFTDNAISAIATRIRLLDAKSVRLPSFTFKSIQGLQVKLYDGALNGLDSIYRRSVATGYKERDIRKVDSIVGFSSLKVIYNYEAMIPTGVPPLTGVLTLLANDVTAHMALAMVSEPETVDLDMEFLDHLKPESLTVEGAANVMISNFKHLLEHQIVAVMSNTLTNGVIMLKSLPRCEPFIPGQIKNKKIEKYQMNPEWASNGDSSTSEFEDVPGQIENKKIHKYQPNTDWASNSDSSTSELEDVLRGKGKPQRPPAKHPKSPMKQSNRSKIRKIERQQKRHNKKNQTGSLKKYKRKNKRKQEINQI